jgi:hypothetical protein
MSALVFEQNNAKQKCLIKKKKALPYGDVCTVWDVRSSARAPNRGQKCIPGGEPNPHE